MSKKKIAGIAVGGFLVLSMIGNAIGSPDSKPKPFTPPAVAVSHASKDASHAIKSVSKQVKLVCGTPGTDKAGFLEAPKWRNCTTPPKPYCGSHKTEAQKNYWNAACRRTEAQKRADKRAAAAEAAAEKRAESMPESCASKDADIGVISAITGNIGNAVDAGKAAWDEAGTGDQC